MFRLEKPPKLKGALELNGALMKARYHLIYLAWAPESFVVIEDETSYVTGTQDGKVIYIEYGTIMKTIRFTTVEPERCDGSYETEHICGRPVGLRRFDEKRVLVADAYLGIYLVNFENGTYEIILQNGTVHGKPIKYFNDVEALNDDVFIFTESSTKWERRDFMHAILEGIPNGRVLRFTRSTGKIEVLMDGLYFANGIQLFPDKKSFLITETGAARIRRYWIAGPFAGRNEIFAENLPGLPGNIRSGTGETFWLGMLFVRHSDHFSLYDYLASRPNIRKCILQLIPPKRWEWILGWFRKRHALVIKLNGKGQIISSGHDPYGYKINEITEVVETDKYLYLSSSRAPCIYRVRKDLLL